MSSSEDANEAVRVLLDDRKKSMFVNDLAVICDVDKPTARSMLETNNWDMQVTIDTFFTGGDDDDDDDVEDDKDDVEIIEPGNNSDQNTSTDEPTASGSSSGGNIVDPFSPRDCTKEIDVEIEIAAPTTPGGTNYSTWAPEKFSIVSWNVDGLDEKNLEKRMAAVVDLINTEKHGVVFLQELLPHTFEYIARRLSASYFPIVGTDNPNSEYFAATFLRLHQVIYEDHFLIPFPGTAMDRKLLVTKAFIGRAKLALLNTHLESTGDFAKERTSQLKQCFQMCTSFPPEYNVIFGGDLNLRDKEVAGNLPQGMSDLWVKCGSRSTCQYTWDLTRNTNKQMPSKFQPKCRFDRLYFRDSTPATIAPEFFGVTGIEKALGTQSFPSDHWAIMTFFRLEKEARRPLPKKRKAESLGFE